MKKIMVLILFFSLQSWAGEIVLTGSCEKEVSPDEYSLHLSIEVLNEDLSKALVEARKNYENISNSLKTQAKVETLSFNSNEHYEYESGRRSLVGYKVIIGMKASSKDKEKVDKIINKLHDFKNLKINSLNQDLSYEKRKELRIECLSEALNDAKNAAEKLAKSLERKIGEVKKIQEQGMSYSGPFPRVEMSQMALKSADSMQIDSKEIKVSSKIEVTFDVE